MKLWNIHYKLQGQVRIMVWNASIKPFSNWVLPPEAEFLFSEKRT